MAENDNKPAPTLYEVIDANTDFTASQKAVLTEIVSEFASATKQIADNVNKHTSPSAPVVPTDNTPN
jgi:hypothetical protein